MGRITYRVLKVKRLKCFLNRSESTRDPMFNAVLVAENARLECMWNALAAQRRRAKVERMANMVAKRLEYLLRMTDFSR
jgi:hypothetical protein